ncbi:MAG: carboxypeptidase-like regulatory domain-containing protein [Bacteroidales bacterium]|nr:carboxypeptidase-like regulatory domain-containing protein [Bacteroidales bacterium]
MTHGKNICNQLKEVRKRIAEENDIPLEIEECTYKGECRGTCPRCEAEVRYLENALADRLRLGKVATVAGLALGLAATTVQAAECNPVIPSNTLPIVKEAVHVADSITIKGTVVDSKTNEPLPFVTITIADSNGTTTVTRSDFDGNFSVSVPRGDYSLTINTVGYAKYVVLEDHYNENRTLPTIKLECTAEMLEVVGMIEDKQPVIEIGPNGASQYLEKDGVMVIVR